MAEHATLMQRPPSIPDKSREKHITEDEASLYDRQIRLWGLEAQNRMRSSTVLVLSLKSLAHETIKNLVLAGIGRLIVMDDGVVTEEDLGAGFLFKEEDGALGTERTVAAAPQIESLNPLVSLTTLPTMSPFVRDPSTAGARVNTTKEMIDFLKREKVDVVVACDLERDQLVSIDGAARQAGVMFYGAGTYGFYGYVFADLGKSYEYVFNPPSTSTAPSPIITKKTLSYSSFSEALDGSNWTLPHSASSKGGSPFRELSRHATKERDPTVAIAILALWEYEKRHGGVPVPSGVASSSSSNPRKRRRAVADEGEPETEAGDEPERGPGPETEAGEQGGSPAGVAISNGSTREEQYEAIYRELKEKLGVNEKALKSDPKAHQKESDMIEHLATHASDRFPPTLAILGGLLAQDVLRCLSKKDKPIVNLLAVDSMGGTGAVSRWAMGDAVDAAAAAAA